MAGPLHCRARAFEAPAAIVVSGDILGAMARAAAGTMDAYLAGLPPAQRDALARVRAEVARLAPDAVEGTSYGMPAFLLDGRPLLGFRAAARHLSVHPFSPTAVDAVRDRMDPSAVSKGTVRFTPEAPLPEGVLEDLVRARRGEIAP